MQNLTLHCVFLFSFNQTMLSLQQIFFFLLFSCVMSGLVFVLTVPALYEKYEHFIDGYGLTSYKKLKMFYCQFDRVCISRVQSWILEKKKLSWYTPNLQYIFSFSAVSCSFWVYGGKHFKRGEFSPAAKQIFVSLFICFFHRSFLLLLHHQYLWPM